MLRKPKEWLFVLTSAVAFRERETEAADSAAEAAAADAARDDQEAAYAAFYPTWRSRPRRPG